MARTRSSFVRCARKPRKGFHAAPLPRFFVFLLLNLAVCEQITSDLVGTRTGWSPSRTSRLYFVSRRGSIAHSFLLSNSSNCLSDGSRNRHHDGRVRSRSIFPRVLLLLTALFPIGLAIPRPLAGRYHLTLFEAYTSETVIGTSGRREGESPWSQDITG